MAVSGPPVDRDESPGADGAEEQCRAPGRLYALVPLLFVAAFVGVLALAGVGGGGSPDDGGAARQGAEVTAAVVSSGDEAEQALVSAWERYRTSTFSVSSEFVRETTLGGELHSETSIVQRPPDRIVRQGGGAIGQIEGVAVDCVTTSDEEFVCAEAAAAAPYEQDVAEEIEAFEAYFAAEPGLYDVVLTEAGCFELTLRREVVAPDYGNWARMCFDESTGALEYLEIRRPEGVDVTEAVTISTDVADDEFDLIDQIPGA
ncbi:MAG: hypothetical protein JJLCMIEE_01438 [Acidimicrobiales bacterium]|nr:MAG: hypothetical protein EDR02_06540 [Actinomycetota bacterium]MBV6508378.1 hypothetical protein [Acidimicrobiales bacterium]RIK04805.1 MAG: hypothetical protein DCC48_12235 [Acidobacteriota bacterium]